MGLFSGRRRYLTAAVLVVGALVAVILSRRDDIPGPDRLWFMGPLSPSEASDSSSMKPVAMELKTPAQKTIKFNIPRAYIVNVTEPDQTHQRSLTLVVYLPDYLPKALADKAGHQTQGRLAGGIPLRSPNEIAIYVKTSVRDLQQKRIESIKSYSISGGEYRKGFGIYYRRQYLAGSTEPTPDKHSGHLIPTDRDDFSIRFVASPKTGKMVGCSLYFNLNDDIGIETSFPAEHLDQYEQIRKSVSELVSRFLT